MNSLEIEESSLLNCVCGGYGGACVSCVVWWCAVCFVPKDDQRLQCRLLNESFNTLWEIEVVRPLSQS